MSKDYDICIIGGGISGLSSAAFLNQTLPQKRIALLEKESTFGGAIRSFQADGYLAEWGPHGFLDNCQESIDLVQWAGLEDTKEMAPLSRFVRYVCLNGQLECIPQKPLKILRQPLIPWYAKLRVLADLWKPPLEGEPTVAQWVEYRFGKQLLPFADAVFTGTYAGDIHKLKIDAVMPGVRRLEHEKGSVIRGLISRLRQKKKKQTQQKKKGLPSMTSFVGGMEQLPRALAATLEQTDGLRLLNNCEALAISHTNETWTITTTDGDMTCSDLIIALPINPGLALLSTCNNVTPPPFQNVPEAAILSVLLGFDQQAQIPFGFGYLAPEKEERFLLGTLFSSQMFPGRAPENLQLVEALVGGRRHPERLQLCDEELIQKACSDLQELMKLPNRPVFSQVLRPIAKIPQLEEHATALFQWREQQHANTASLHICGFGWKGIGLNDMIKEAAAMAKRCANNEEQQAPEIKPVYF